MKNYQNQTRVTLQHSLIFLFIFLAVVMSLNTFIHSVLAQETESVWSDHINLSNSGGASNPKMLIDSSGQVHVYWLDVIDGITYAYRNRTGSWSEPVKALVPFEDSIETLVLLPDPNGLAHAFWIDEFDNLLYSFTDYGEDSLGWGGSQILAMSVVDFHVTMDDDLVTHMAFAYTEGSAAGIYYITRATTGIWSNLEAIYTSSYFRNITSANAHMSIAPGEQGRIYLTFDDPYKEQVLVSWSEDNGNTWSSPIILDERDEMDTLESVGPSKGLVSIHDGEVVFLWQAGHEGAVCETYSAGIPSTSGFRVDGQDGTIRNSTEIQTLKLSIQGCPDQLEVIDGDRGGHWLLTQSTFGIQLSRWSGPDLSPFQPQGALTGFTHPETFRRIDLESQAVELHNSQLFGVGSDSGIAGDIWFTERSMGSEGDWYPTPTPAPLWSTPAVISHGDQTISNPVLLSSMNGSHHTLWSDEDGGIRYSMFDRTRWIQPVKVITSPGEQIGELSAEIERNGNLILVWDSPGNDEIYFSWVNVSDAVIPGEWVYPQALPISGGGRAPQVRADSDGYIYIAFTIPLNESRGIYLIKSQGPLTTGEPIEWGTPVKVFDAVEAGWSMVGSPQLALQEGNLFIQWKRFSPPPGERAMALYGAVFTDGIWMEPEEIKLGQISWSQVVSTGNGHMHRVWQEQDSSGRLTLWHQFSTDIGVHWSDEVRISSFFNDQGAVALVVDPANHLHLIVVSQSGFISLDNKATLLLQDWIFDNREWVLDERLTLDDMETPINLKGSSGSKGFLAALLLAEFLPESEEFEPEIGLFFSQRPVELSPDQSQPLPTFTPQPTIASDDSEQVPTQTPRPTFPTENGDQRLPFLNNTIALIVLSGIPAALIVMIVLIRGLRKTNKNR